MMTDANGGGEKPSLREDWFLSSLPTRHPFAGRQRWMTVCAAHIIDPRVVPQL